MPNPNHPSPRSRGSPSGRRAARGFLGLTSFQGFFLALMVFLNVCVLGAFALVALERVRIPGL